MKKELLNYLFIAIGSILYAVATVAFIFPHSLLLGGTSGIMFYVNSSSGGTDIIALIVKKYSKINIGKALLITDFMIVVVGGLLSGHIILASSFIGLIIKTFGIDLVIDIINN